MVYKLVINMNKYGGKAKNMPSLNEWIDSERIGSRRGKRLITKGSVLKKKWQTIICTEFKKQVGNKKAKLPIKIEYHFYEKDRRRDKGNIAPFPQKVIEDALQEVGFIPNDGWKEIEDFRYCFHVDGAFPRIEVIIFENDVQQK